jgi:hypothetical protein
MAGRTFDQLIDFTRTSAATFVNSSGNIASTAQSRNLLTFTQQFDNAAWTKTRSTITANTTTAPDGTSTADTLNEDSTASSTHPVSVAVTLAAAAHTLSLYVKASGRSWVQLNLLSTANAFANFNVATGALGTVGSAATATITSVGNGWYRCTMTATTGAGANTVAIYPTSADNTVSFTGTGIASLFIWGAQLEQASAATDYTRNVGGLFPPRFDYDPVTRAPRGLLIEEQRTNLLTYSEQFDNAAWTKSSATVTANATVAPDGTTTADRLIPAAASVDGRAAQTFTGSAGATYTLTVFGKADAFNNIRLYSDDGATNLASVSYNLATGAVSTAANVGGTWTAVSTTSAAVGNGWYRLSLTWTATGAAPTRAAIWCRDTGDGTSGIFIWGAQLEAGAFATSYIPTVASQVTRAADVATITGANFTPWYNQSAGTFVVEGSRLHGGNSYAALAVARAAGGITERIDMGLGSGQGGSAGVFRDDVVVGGVNQAALGDFAAFAANTPYRGALAYAANDFASATSGANLATDASGTVPTVALLDLGNRNSGNFLNGHIRRLTFYPSRLSNAQLQALTA